MQTNSYYGGKQQMRLPSATDVERALIGALINTRGIFDEVNARLTVDDFYDNNLRVVYEAIYELENKGIDADMITVTNSLKSKHDDFMPYYQAMLDAAGDPQRFKSIGYMIAIIQQQSKRRQVVMMSNQLISKALDDSQDIADVLAEADTEVSKIIEIGINTEFKHAKEVFPDVYGQVKKASLKDGSITGIPTLLDSVDSLIGGLHAPDLVVIAARPAMGKTALGLTMATNMAILQDYPVGFFTLEMSSEQLVKRVLSQLGSIQSGKLRSGDLSSSEWMDFDKAGQSIIDGNLYIDETPALDLSEFKSKARKMVKQYDVKVIVVDYLQLMTVRGIRNRQEQVASVSRGLKAIAKELNIPVIALAQLNRGTEQREGLEGKRPKLSDLRESGAIEQDADIVAMIHRPEYYGVTQDPNTGESLVGVAELLFVKHRNGATDDLKLRFRGEYTRFENIDDTIVVNTANEVPF